MSEKFGVWAWWSWEMCLERIKDEKDVSTTSGIRDKVGWGHYVMIWRRRTENHVMS